MLGLITKEIKLLFLSKLIFCLIIFFVFTSYLFFFFTLIAQKTVALDFFFKSLESLIIFSAPLFSLRFLAWERSKKTIILIMLSPIKKINFILAKYIAAVIIFLLINIFLLLPFIWLGFITNFYLPKLILGFLGINLLFLFILSLASFFSVFFNGAILNAALTFFFTLIFYLFFETDFFSSEENLLTNFLFSINPFYHLENFKLGIFNSSDLVYFFLVNFNLLFLAGQLFENQTLKE